ncbi:MAG TPA: hypothetical protein VNW29_05590 [Candidatus Sulfotelmatobacter sp.]|jgi:hypothetical protein|nr:hypothetical protein [Candidatus Sulfotelmatobacter sp.]
MNNIVKQFIKSDKFILIIFSMVFLVLGSILVISLIRKNQLVAQPTFPLVTTSTQQSNHSSSAALNQSNPLVYFFSWIFPSQNTTTSSGQTVTQQTISTEQNITGTQVNQSVSQSNVKQTTSISQLGGNTGGSSGNSSSLTTNTFNPNVTNFQIVFLGPDGQLQIYIPPTTPPIQITWTRYTNIIDHYSVDYPSNWQLKTQDTNGHSGISLYLPTANIQDPNQQYVGFGWSSYNLFPANDPSSQSYATQAMVTGVSGTLYTHGTIGSSYIIAILPYNGGYFGIGSTASDPTFAYVYLHMLQSLTFGN